MAGPLPLPIPREGAELVRHVEFVRRLARGLVADTATSEDLAQEAWVATLERRKPLAGSLRAWLARVLRNRAALALRRGERRARREATRAAVDESVPTAELVERMELHGRVVAAVLALPEAYREVVLRRYFEDESIHDIARRLGLPEATVRTQLARAQARLRQRLEAHFGGERAHAVLALARLAREGVPASGMTLPPLASLTLSLAMKKTVAVLCVALVVLVVAWSVQRGTRARHAAETTQGSVAALPATLSEIEPVSASVEPVMPSRAPVEETRPAAVRPEPAPSAPRVEPSAEPLTAWLEFHVRDPQGRPVSDAKVQLTCYRTREDSGSSHSISEMPAATTDAGGTALLEYPRVLEAWNGPERPQIGSVCYTVEHPDFVAVRELKFPVENSPAEVVLRHGALLIVAGFLGERSALVTDVVPHLSDEVRAEASDWVPVRDGRLSCNRIPPGRHAVYLTREGEGGTWASAMTEFELGEEEVKELTLELHPPRTLTGSLDPAVPRPVEDGEVLLNVHVGRLGDRAGPRGMRLFRAPVRSDGRFEIAGLPPGTGEMIGMCEGWVSTEVAASDSEGEKKTFATLQQLDPSSSQPFVLAMERTARLEVLILDPEGEPVEGAMITMWPNVHWSSGYSQIFLDREWRAVTDASGRTEIENIPAGDETLAVVHRDLCLPIRVSRWGSSRRDAEAQLAAGETTPLELRLERCNEGR